MTTWHYEHGTWTETTFLDDSWADGTDLDELCKQLGYEHHLSVGDTDGWCARVHRRSENPRYLVGLYSLDVYEVVTAATLPDALDLLARWAPIVAAAEITDALSDLRDLSPLGIVPHVLASAELNRQAADHLAAEQRALRERAAVRRAEQRRKAAQ